MKNFDPKLLRTFGKDLLMAYGTSVENADIIADHLINNDMLGVEQQGALRFFEYVRFMDKGELDGSVIPDITDTGNGILRVDGKGGIGVVALHAATEAIKEQLKARPMAFAAITNCGHTGRVGAFVEDLAKNYCFGMAMGGGAFKRYHTVAPFGGTKGVISTNPISLAMPGKDGVPVSADFATSATAGGVVRMAIRKKQQMAPGCLIDKDGNPTTDPNAFYEGGFMLPAAGPKGYGMALIIEMMTYALLGTPLEFNWVIMGMRLDAVCPEPEYAERAQEYLDFLNSSTPKPGFSKVYYPGQYEASIRTRKEETGEGIAVYENVVESMVEMARKKNVPIPVEFL